VVRVLMVRHVKDAVEMDRREDWKHAEEVGNEIIKEAMLHERVMRGLVAQAGQAMLDRADQRDRYPKNREVPEPGNPPARPELREQNRPADDGCQATVLTRQAEQVRKAIEFPQSHDLMMELWIVIQHRHPTRRGFCLLLSIPSVIPCSNSLSFCLTTRHNAKNSSPNHPNRAKFQASMDGVHHLIEELKRYSRPASCSRPVRSHALRCTSTNGLAMVARALTGVRLPCYLR